MANLFQKYGTLVLILLLAAGLRLFGLDLQSLWVDEIITAKLTHPDLSFGEAASNFRKTAHPPLYFILIHLFTVIFGAAPWVLKLFSAILGIAGVYGMYRLGKELINREVGLYAALFTSINYFHLYYSQEARMYSLFFLVVVWSFYFLIRFLKEPTLKNSILYGLLLAAVINTHFFGLFTMASQCFILLYYVVFPIGRNRKYLIYYSALAGIITAISYIPVYTKIISHAKTTSLWIPKPHQESLENMFAAVFGNSEVLIVFFILLMVFFFSQMVQFPAKKLSGIDPSSNKKEFAYFLILSCLVIGILLPFYRSSIRYSIIIDRYFINLLPLLFLLFAIGISFVKNKVLQVGIALAIVLFSLNHTFYQKWHYQEITKSQFREVSEYIDKNNPQNSKVISPLAFYYDYYIEGALCIDQSIKEQISEFKNDSISIQSFWYASGHNQEFEIGNSDSLFLDKHFVLKDSVQLFDAWARFYELNQ